MMADETINQAGGIQGKPVVIVAADSNAVFDDVEDYETNKSIIAQWVIDNDLKAVIGPLIPELGQRLAPELRRQKVVHISGSVAPASTLAASARCSFNFLPSFQKLGDALGDRMVADGATTTGMIYLTDDYGIKMKDGIFAGFSNAGGTVTGISPTTLGKPSYVDDITNAISDEPDALVMITYPKTGSSIVIESLLTSRELPNWYFAPSLRVNDFVANVPKGRLAGSVGVAPGLDDRSTSFTQRYEAQWSGRPLLDGYYYFDAIISFTPDILRDAPGVAFCGMRLFLLLTTIEAVKHETKFSFSFACLSLSMTAYRSGVVNRMSRELVTPTMPRMMNAHLHPTPLMR